MEEENNMKGRAQGAASAGLRKERSSELSAEFESRVVLGKESNMKGRAQGAASAGLRKESRLEKSAGV